MTEKYHEKGILLRTGDSIGEKEYGRMLELEFSERGIGVNEKGAEVFALLLVYDTCDPAKAEKDAADADGIPVICFAGEYEEPAPEGMILEERPLDTEKLCDFVLSFRPGEKTLPSVKGRVRTGLSVDQGTRSVSYNGEPVPLSAKEFRLLSYLCDNRGRAVSREELLSAVWDDTAGNDTNVADVYIRYLRKKLDERFDIRLIRTVRGKGYMLTD